MLESVVDRLKADCLGILVSSDHRSVLRWVMYGCYINRRNLNTLRTVARRCVDSVGIVVRWFMDSWCVDDGVETRGAYRRRSGRWWFVHEWAYTILGISGQRGQKAFRNKTDEWFRIREYLGEHAVWMV